MPDPAVPDRAQADRAQADHPQPDRDAGDCADRDQASGGQRGVRHNSGRMLGGARGRSLLSLLDQALLSGLAFLMTVLMGRYIGAAELGVFALAYTVVVLSMNVQMALVSIPYTNQWRRRPSEEHGSFAAGALIQHAWLSLILAALIEIVVGVLFFFEVATDTLLVLGILGAILPPVLAREFFRRFAFAHLKIGTAVTIDATAAVISGLGMLALLWLDRLSAANAFVVLGIGAGVGGIGALVRMRHLFEFSTVNIAQTLVEHWRFGRWVLASLMCATIQGYVIHWLLAWTSGAAATGVFAACMTLVLLMNPLLLGIGNLLESEAAKRFADAGHSGLRLIVWRFAIGLVAIMSLYFVALALFGSNVLTMLFDGEEFQGQQNLLNLLGLTLVIGAIELPHWSGLRAMARPEVDFSGGLVSVLITMIGGLLLIPMFGMLGGACALLTGRSVGMLIRVYAFLRLSAPTESELSAALEGSQP